MTLTINFLVSLQIKKNMFCQALTFTFTSENIRDIIAFLKAQFKIIFCVLRKEYKSNFIS